MICASSRPSVGGPGSALGVPGQRSAAAPSIAIEHRRYIDVSRGNRFALMLSTSDMTLAIGSESYAEIGTRLLVRKFFAQLDVRTPKFNALGVVHRALSDHFRKEEVDEGIDFALDQCRRWVRHHKASRHQISLLEAVAAPIAVAQAVECRHAGPGPATLDGRNQVFALELGLAQIRAIGHLVVHLAAITGPAVAGLAISLLPVELAASRNVRSIGCLRLHGGSGDDQ